MNRQEAIKAGVSLYFTGKPCKYGHVADRMTISGNCTVCYRQTRKHFQKQYRQKHHDSITAARKKRMQQADLHLQTLEYHRNWAKQNRAKCTAWTARYRQAKENRTPKWINKAEQFEIDCIYLYCAALNSIGLDYHVDHIVPLRGKLVSGLHVPNNLQVIPASDNFCKSNSFAVK